MVIFEENIEGATERSLARFLTIASKLLGLRGKVNVVITNNRAMRNLNRRFRSKNKPTDVLSFPAIEISAHEFCGDIAISAEIAAESARNLGHETAMELKILVLHGLLHLAGYDHETDGGRMARKERKLRRELNLPDGLIERASEDGSKMATKPARRRRS